MSRWAGTREQRLDLVDRQKIAWLSQAKSVAVKDYNTTTV